MSRAFPWFASARSVVYVFGFVATWAWLAIVARSFDPRIPVSLAPWLRPIGYALATVGALLTAWCVVTFVASGRGTPAPFDPPREFVATGPYAWVRNPMYLGAAGVIAGAGLVVSSPGIVLLAVAFLAFFHVFVLVYEEPTLTRTFGASYTQYRARVSRWWIRKPR